LHGKVPIFFHTGKRSEQIARVNSVSIFYTLGVLDGTVPRTGKHFEKYLSAAHFASVFTPFNLPLSQS